MRTDLAPGTRGDDGRPRPPVHHLASQGPARGHRRRASRSEEPMRAPFVLGVRVLLRLLGRDQDRGLAQDLVVREDPAAESNRERERVGRSGGHLERGAVPLEVDHGVEGALAELRDHDVVHRDGHLLEDVLQQIVGHRARRHDALERERDRGGLRLADPDREVPLPLGLPQEHDGLARGELDPDAREAHLDQHRLVRRYPRPLPPATYVSSASPPGAGRNRISASGSAWSAGKSCTARISGMFRYRSWKSSPYPTRNTSGHSNPRYRICSGAIRRTDLSSRAQTSTDAGSRERRTLIRQDKES